MASMRMEAGARGLLVVAAGLGLTAGAAAQQFVDQTATRFPNPNPQEYTNQLTIGDINNDALLDIIFANGEGFSGPGSALQQRVFVNIGFGRFRDESAMRLNFFGYCRGVEMGDIDNDNDLDLIFAQDFSHVPQLFVNDGLGYFTNVTAAQMPNIALSSSRAQFGDIDNDGDLDLYITSGTSTRFTCGQYRVYVNDGAGFFTDETALRHPIGNVCNNMDCIFGDIDGDFDLDVRTASTGTNNSRLYRNDGTGVFTSIGTIPPDNTCYSYDFGDIDGDGDLDLLGVNGGSGSSEILLSNDGAGNFSNVSGQISPNPSQDDNDSKFLDYDDDGDLDLLIGRLGSGGEKLYSNDGAGNFTQVVGALTVVSDSTLDIMVADLTSTGRFDIVTAQGESGQPEFFQNRVYTNMGPADTHPPTIVATEQITVPAADSTDPYVFRAEILDSMTSDRNFFDRGITANYTVNGGPVQQAPMRYSGGQVYRGEIPAQLPGSEVAYYVTAKDFANNVGTGATLTFTVPGSPLGDLNDDGIVSFADLLIMLGDWGPCPDPPAECPADLDGDGSVGFSDLLLLLGNWT